MQKVPRLLEQFIPDNYKLTLELNRLERIFKGTIIISGKTNTIQDSISLHSKDLDIQSIYINDIPVEFSFGQFDELQIHTKTQTDVNYCIEIKYSGKITDSMHGLYPCYFEHDNQKKELLATQFESHHAREVFPCIDEPAAKATYDVTLITEKNITVLGNTPIIDQSETSTNLVTTFATTPIMSSYLLAFVVGELHKKTAHTKDGIEVNIWATPAQSPDSLDFALDISTRTIDFFNEYFDTPYPLTKCDHVALPDFSSGAMENWGLITYREMALLADPKTSSISDRRYIATVITHELSHQWFGNLVTMDWWNDLWLNESFASLVEYTAVDALEPSWNVWLDFASFDSISALKRDSVAGVQSVQTDVNHPDEISTLFDGAIVYSKGARLMQMLQNYIGDENFRLGLRNYFKKFAYKNTVANDLWNEFSLVSGMDIASFMNQWISQPGYPVVHIERLENDIKLTQNRLTTNNTLIDNQTWPIPLNSNNIELPKKFDTKSLQITASITEPIRLNIGSYAHFITHYSDDLFDQLVTKLKNNEFEPIDRLQILNEQSILANSGIVSSATLVKLLEAYENETSEPVWDIIAITIGELKKYVDGDDESEQKLRELTKKLAVSEYNRLGWVKKDNENDTDTKLRSGILSLMLYSEDKEVIASALKLYREKPITELDPEIRSLLISNAIRHEKDYSIIKSIIDIYTKTNSTSLQQDICVGLTSVKSTEIAAILLELVKDSAVIRNQDAFRWIIYLIRNKYTKEITWQWVRNNWSWIEETFKGDKSYDEYPRYCASALSNQKQLEEYKEFFMPMLEIPSLSRVITMGINEITDRISVIERDKAAVRAALNNL